MRKRRVKGVEKYGRGRMSFTNGDVLENGYIGDVVVISGVRRAGRSVDYRAQGRRSHGLFYVWEGEACFESESGQRLIAHSKELVYLPSGEKYRTTYIAPATTFVLVNFGMWTRAGEPHALGEGICVSAVDDRSCRIAGVMAALETCGGAKTAGAVLKKRELLYRLLGVVCDGARFGGAQADPRIANGVRLLEQTYLENLPVSRLAKESRISVSVFRDLFHKQYGTSPVKYRNHLRILRAKELLADGGHTVSEVAYACGFENVGYFCRAYRAAVGEAPGETKKKSTER